MARFIPPKRKEKDRRVDSAWHQARTCAVCGISPYPWGRCNKFSGWDERNPGHRGGWGRTERKICLRCMSTRQTERVLNLVQLPPKRESA